MRDKIKSIDELCSIIPRNKKIAMCHGVFDIIHPGHLRHLMYAKEQSDILIASLTTDKFIQKGEDRPYVPEELRAINLAALEMVDYVIIDTNPTPIENILKIKPNYFIKGFEYNSGINPKTKEEEITVSSYGGKILFSPGDIVYSSTHLLSIHKPKLTIEKLLTIMECENITFDDLLDTLHKFKDIKVHVIGDTIVDKYSYCSLLGQTTKTPTFSIKRESEKMFVGGAGIVTKHFQSLGANVEFTTLFGIDKITEFVVDNLNDIKLNILSDNRSTTLKERFWCDGYKLLQVDTLDNRPISDKILNQVIIKDNTDIAVFSDFRHGIFNKRNIKYLSNLIPKNTIKVADSQVSNRWGNILEYQNFDIIFPNEKEARFALADQDTAIRPLGLELYRKSNAKYLILKLGEKGTLTYRGIDNKPKDFFALDSFVEKLVDANGAGDAMLAITSLAYKVSNNIVISSILGSLGAACACEKEGNVPITIQEIKEKIDQIRNL